MAGGDSVGARDGLWERFGAALYEPFVRRGERLGLADRRGELLRRARGQVVEIGAGTGLNVAHYPATAEVVLTEPVPAMYRRLEKRVAGRAGMRLVQAPADALPMAEASVDTVVSTLVLCTVPDVDRVLAELARVLRPGGRLLFCEHVRAEDPKLARRQTRLAGPWAAFAQGCRCDRDTVALLKQRFHIEEMSTARWRGMPSVVHPLIIGTATA
ncbi:methyltransferase type 11 [Amycolatopsis mediterranei S699]|uniref:Methyltransferase type 11 n=3 Tax=Amycolatopsis mediterranei TaxID=33910 RepID=A0A0H3D7P2_AMYMU|nr:class I SAM-dependent methyltransferase [Amycolatopsis mediterranei]ADJ45554.1 methyltransferase type 11 [Amycolatopsis mediterranei U32]AEK42330.1 methyltransferase type 11 [Amycolatopsis mediterranei S699]AFO77266.1 methyltransferase type 11 [Amycolatopsis mediterranei S699]AGT84394.1 methyltransferase type 11 [Amycolatopsis mediterranei RB]KDO05812.1 methyltransferase type 11 [Amycolatopsis mediterranei]